MTICYYRKLPSFFEARNLAHPENAHYYKFKASQYEHKDLIGHSFYECMKCLCRASECFSYKYKRLWVRWAAIYYVRAIKNGGRTK